MVLGVALALLSLVGIAQALLLQRDLRAQELRRLERELSQVAGNLDTLVADQATGWLFELSRSEDVAAREEMHRLQVPWFDAFYLWEPGARGRPNFIYPAEPLEEDVGLLRSAPCLDPYWKIRQHPNQDFVILSLQGCFIDPRPMVRLFAATESANRLLAQHRYAEALQNLVAAELPLNPSLDQLSAMEMPPQREAARRIQMAEALIGLGREESGIRLLTRTAADITQQDGPILEKTLDYVEWWILPLLRDQGQQQIAAEVDDGVRRAERRLAGWKEIRDELSLRGEPPPPGEPPRLVYDLYGDPPFLLFYTQLDEGERVGAVQLEQSALLDELLSQAGEERSYMVVRDANDEVLAGNRSDEAILVEADLRTLNHLSLGFRQSVLDTPEHAPPTHIWLPMVLPIFGALLGGLALFASVAAGRREQELLERQREFATRVTHELKTPLAGIRVMAETLEMGMYEDAATTRQFSKRIIDETERLTQRVEEILKVARSREVSKPVPLDLSDLVEELADEWEPRMEDAGVILNREIDEPVEVTGDAALLRDALACLLDNALKYRAPEEEQSEVWLTLRRDGRAIWLEVADNGIGVPASHRKRIFERFARVEGPGRGKSGGHGLGLSFVADALQAHGGRVECRAGPSGGARFIARIPISQNRWWPRLQTNATRRNP